LKIKPYKVKESKCKTSMCASRVGGQGSPSYCTKPGYNHRSMKVFTQQSSLIVRRRLSVGPVLSIPEPAVCGRALMISWHILLRARDPVPLAGFEACAGIVAASLDFVLRKISACSDATASLRSCHVPQCAGLWPTGRPFPLPSPSSSTSCPSPTSSQL
jgi:hypothetical protein